MARDLLLIGTKANSTMRLVLALVLLTPFLNGFAPLLQDGGSCRMACCKNSKSCCHKSKEKLAAQRWTAPPACPSGCAQHFSLSASSSPTFIACHCNVGPTLQSTVIQLRADSLADRMATEFALFERPPPTSGQTRCPEPNQEGRIETISDISLSRANGFSAGIRQLRQYKRTPD